MANLPVQTSTATGSVVLPILLPCFLIGNFIWKLLSPAHGFPMRTEQVMTMVFDFGMLLSLCSLRRAIPAPLFWIALVAGVGMFALRLSHDGWWTGHLTYSLPPR
ncbi:MAG: hypothetical protein H0V72_13035 [Bradyrhizobium sp.]|nr:hypothetical protein [Bradyrhizobium sp.]